MILPRFLLLGCAATLAACQPSVEAHNRLRAVGSSTVYPFTTAVAEQFARRHPGAAAPIVEATGTGAGIKLFCAGTGPRHPDIADASRRMQPGERRDCAAHGVRQVVELQIGLDGIILAQPAAAPRLALTETDIYRAVAAEPFGQPNRATVWADVNPALPAWPILVYGPPATSGTRDAFADLVLVKGCDTQPAMYRLRATDAPLHRRLCTRVRDDGRYVETGENDNLIVQKLASEPRALGVFGYSFLKEHADRLRGVPIRGVHPDYAAIAQGRYPGARPLYVYLKGEHLGARPEFRSFMREFARGWGDDGYLRRRGLIASPSADRQRAERIVARLAPDDGGPIG